VRIDIDSHYFCRGRNEAARHQKPVEPQSRGNQHIRLGKAEHQTDAAHVHHRMGVTVRQFSASVIHQHKGNSRFFDKRFERVGFSAEAHAAAADKQRIFCIVDDLCSGFQIGVVRMHRVFAGGTPGHRRQRFFDLNTQNIRRQLQKYRTGASLHRVAEGNGKIFGNPFGIITGGRPFGDGMHDVHLIDFLQGPFQIVAQRMPAA